MLKGYWLLGTRDNLENVQKLREEVFVYEQGFPIESERDELDERSLHVALYNGEELIATGRLTPLAQGEYKIGRLAVKKAERGKGYGSMVIRMLMDRALDAGAAKLIISSQLHAMDIYAHFGFEVAGEEYLEEGKPHRKMVATRETARFPRKCGANCASCEASCK